MRKHVLSKLQTLPSSVPPPLIFVPQFSVCKVSDLYGKCCFPSIQNRVTWVILDLGPGDYNKYLPCQETRRFNVAFTTARLLSLSSATLILSMSFHYIFSHLFNIISTSTPNSSNWSPSLSLPSENLISFFFPFRSTVCAHLILLYLFTSAPSRLLLYLLWHLLL